VVLNLKSNPSTSNIYNAYQPNVQFPISTNPRTVAVVRSPASIATSGNPRTSKEPFNFWESTNITVWTDQYLHELIEEDDSIDDDYELFKLLVEKNNLETGQKEHETEFLL